MIRVISGKRWVRWCEKKQLPISDAHIALETCYYGLGLRSRPGSIHVTEAEMSHFSYSWRDTLWAILEPSVRITIPITTIREIGQLKLGSLVRFVQLNPDSAFRVTTNTGETHDFVFQRNGDDFLQVVHSLGITVSDEKIDV